LDCLSPVAASERSRFLDILRGIALLGILPANIPFFGLPLWDASEGAEPAEGGSWVAWHATRFLVDYKFITIFSLLFGCGMAVIASRAFAVGRPFRALLARRLGVLALIGIAHGTLIWYGDIVAYYGLLGLTVFWFAAARSRWTAIIGALLVLVPVPFLGAWAVLTQIVPELSGEDDYDWQPWTAEEEARVYSEGTFAEMLRMRVLSWLFGWVFFGFMFSWRIVGLMLLGMAMVNAGWFLRPADHRRAFARLAGWGLALGIPVQAAANFLAEMEGPSFEALAELAQYLGSLGMAAGYIGVVGLVVARFGASRLWSPFEAVGRTAFSNYLLQSALCTGLFYAWGLGLFGALNRVQLLLVVAGVWALQLAVSSVWVRAFRFGPVEWLWRWATYGQRP
jgi:uncharacterized protein